MTTPNTNGPDTSHWNEYTGAPYGDWPVHSLKCSEGGRYRDPTFKDRWKEIHEKGTKYCGSYFWIRSDWTIADQVKNYLGAMEVVGGFDKGDFSQLDWETTPGVAVPTSLHAAEAADRVNQAVGREVCITYLGTWLPDSPLDPDTIREALEWRQENPTAPLWLAYYNTADAGGWAACAQWKADVWQWTSNYYHPAIRTPARNTDGTIYYRGFDMNHVFNWAVLDRLTDQVPPTPPPEDPVSEYVFISPHEPEFEFEPGKYGVFTQDGHPVTGDYIEALRALGAKVSILNQAPHVWWKEATLHKLGEQARRLYGDSPAE